MPLRLCLDDVAKAIERTLAGKTTKTDLAKWAFQAQLDEDSGRMSFDEPHWDEIKDAIYDLMLMDEGVQHDMTDAELARLARRLEAAAQSP